MNYDDYASRYAHTRTAVKWVLNSILQEVKLLPKGSSILEIGCGTGNYIIEIINMVPDINYFGFDISKEMLKVAEERNNTIKFLTGNADEYFPYPDKMFELEFMVDVIHHITRPDICFREARRTMKDEGILLIVTDSYNDMNRRSLTKFFPEVLEIEIDRYPSIDELNKFTNANGFKLIEAKQLQGTAELTDEFVTKLEQKCSSAMRLIPDEMHGKGMKRVIEAKKKGEMWHSYYTMLKFINK